MTLKEEFLELAFAKISSEELRDKCIEITESFSICFADWIRVCKLKGRPYDFENVKELLEIYKKEKGL
jgi:hypothetical protein